MNPLNPFFSLLSARGVDPKEYAAKFSASLPEIVDESKIGSKDFQLLVQIRDALAEQSPDIDKYFIFNASNPTKIRQEVAVTEIDDEGVEWAVADDEDECEETKEFPIKISSQDEEIDELEWVAAEEEGVVHAKSDEDVKRTIQRLKNQALVKLQDLENTSADALDDRHLVLIHQIKQDVSSIVHELLEYTSGMAAHEDVVSMKISLDHYFEKFLGSRDFQGRAKPVPKAADLKEVLPVVQNGLGDSIQPKNKFWQILELTSSVAKGVFKGIEGLFASARVKASQVYDSFVGKKEYGPLSQQEMLDQNIQMLATQVATSIAANVRNKYFLHLPTILADGLQKLVAFVLSTKQFLPYVLSNFATSAYANLIADPERAKEIVDRFIDNEIAILGDELQTVYEITSSVEAAHPDISKRQLEGAYLKALRDSGKLSPGLEPSLTPKELEIRDLELSGMPIPVVDQEEAKIVRLKCQAQEHLFYKAIAQNLYEQLLLPNGLSPQLALLQKLAGADFKQLSIEQITLLIEKLVNHYAEPKNIFLLVTGMLHQVSQSLEEPDLVKDFSSGLNRFLAGVELLPEKMKREEAVDVRSVGLKFEDTPEDPVLSFQPKADLEKLLLPVSRIVLKGAPITLLEGVKEVSSSVLQKVQSAPKVQKVVAFAAERRYDRAIMEKVGRFASPIIQKVTGLRAFQGAQEFFKAKFEAYRIAEKSQAVFQSVVSHASAVKGFALAQAEKGIAKKVKAKVLPSIQRTRNKVLERLHHSGDKIFEERLNWLAGLVDRALRPQLAAPAVVSPQELTEEEMRKELSEALREVLVKFRVISKEERPEVVSRFIENSAQFATNNIVNQLGSKVLNRHLILSFLDGFLGAFSKG